ncbi:MAG: hypothetical protein ACYC7E_02010 [Armatimonadota bacterium]
MMELVTVEKALEDVELIKGIMQRTSTSLAGFSRVLLWWGGAWMAVVVLGSLLSSPLMTVSPDVARTTNSGTLIAAYLLLLAAFSLFVIGVAMGISTYRRAIADPCVSALTRGLVSIWGMVALISFVFPLIFGLLCAVQEISLLMPQIMQFNFSATTSATSLFTSAGLFTPFAHAMEIWLFALALYTTRAFTRLAFAGWLGLIFLLIGLLYPMLGAHFGNYFHPGPYALLILGGYLELFRRKEAI